MSLRTYYGSGRAGKKRSGSEVGKWNISPTSKLSDETGQTDRERVDVRYREWAIVHSFPSLPSLPSFPSFPSFTGFFLADAY